MRRIDYEPPLDPDDKLIHLKAMWEIYKTGIFYPPTIEDLCFDLSFTKLIADVHREIAVGITVGERELPRTKKSSSTKKTKVDTRKGIILAIYNHGNKIHPETNFSQVCNILERQFEESKGDKDKPWGEIPKEMEFPSRDTLENWFKNEGIFARDFIKRGRRSITKM